MKPGYAPTTDQQKLAYLVEECGEVLAAAGKALRWGLDHANPDLPLAAQEPNRVWLAREVLDLQRALTYVSTLLPNPLPRELWYVCDPCREGYATSFLSALDSFTCSKGHPMRPNIPSPADAEFPWRPWAGHLKETPRADPAQIPRRNRVDRMTVEELAIRAVVRDVEALGADPRLTAAVTLLHQARERVADYVDGIGDRDPTRPSR